MMISSRPTAWLVLACLSLALPACAKRSYSPSLSDAASAEGYAGDDYGGGAYEDAPMVDYDSEPTSAAMPAPMDEPEERRFGGFRNRRDKKKAANARVSKSAVAPPAPARPEGESAAPKPETEPEEPQPDADEGRHIIYTAGMRIAVFDLQDAIAAAEALPDRYGGYVQSMSNNQVVLRIPSKNLRTVMTSLGGYGNVEQRWLNSQDVTAEFTDLESRLKALEKTHAQLLDLLAKARTVEEALKVREALDRVAAELEVLKGRLRQLDNATTYSTLTLDFYERGPNTPTPSSNDPFPWVDSLGVESTEWK